MSDRERIRAAGTELEGRVAVPDDDELAAHARRNSRRRTRERVTAMMVAAVIAVAGVIVVFEAFGGGPSKQHVGATPSPHHQRPTPQPPNPNNPVTPGFVPLSTGFWDPTHGLVAGAVYCKPCANTASGAVAVTTNGGVTWRVVATTRRSAGHVVVAPGTSSAWVSAGAERLRSTDFGATWQRLQIGGVVPETFVSSTLGWGVFTVACCSPNSVAGGGTIARTTDGGRTWTGLAAPCPPKWFIGPDAGPSVSFANASVGLADCHWDVGAGMFSNDAVYRTTDAGRTWSRLNIHTVPSGPDQGHPPGGSSMALSPDGTIALSAGRSGTYRTLDGGVTWTSLPAISSPSFFEVGGFSWASPATVFATRSGGLPPAILRSDDAGLTWHVVLRFPYS